MVPTEETATVSVEEKPGRECQWIFTQRGITMAIAHNNVALSLQEGGSPEQTDVIAGETAAWFIRDEPAGFVGALWEYSIDGPGHVVSDEFYPIGNVIYRGGTRLRLIAFKFDSGITKITFKLSMVPDGPTFYAEVHAKATA